MNSNNDDEGMPWVTTGDTEQTEKERIYLTTPDSKNKINPFPDLGWLYFRTDVLEKYRYITLCSVDAYNIIFRGIDRNIVSLVPYIINKGKVMIRAGDFAFLPQIERPHWMKYRLDGDTEK